MEISLQGDSRGIHYEGYDKDFHQCIFEDSDVQGKNERYEFRCTPDLACCGRVCCIPTEAVVPLWVILLFLLLGLLLLASILGTAAWLWAKRRPKKAAPVRTNGYRVIQQQDHTNDDDELARARARQRELDYERALAMRSSQSSASSQPPPPPVVRGHYYESYEEHRHEEVEDEEGDDFL